MVKVTLPCSALCRLSPWSKGNILLLRETTSSSDSDQDGNDATFAAEKNTPFSIPVRVIVSPVTVLTNITELAPVTGLDDFDGIVTTCARSCDALVEENSIGKDGTCCLH